jgi:hypothetical protein
MPQSAQNSREDGDTENSLQQFSVITPTHGSLEWLPIPGERLTFFLDRVPAMREREDNGTGIGGEKSE